MSSDMERARKAPGCIYLMGAEDSQLLVGDTNARVKYGVVLISFALAHKAYRQNTHVDRFHSSGAGEREGGRLDMLV
jgi:hypothetical protein